MNKRRSPKDPDALIEQLASASPTISSLASNHDISTQAHARWLASAVAAHRLNQHTTHFTNAADLSLARARSVAVHTLLDIARGESASETARKACVDILKLTQPNTAQPPIPTDPPIPDDALARSLASRLTATQQDSANQ